MILHRFTDEGIVQFHGFLDSQTTDAPLPWSADVLTDTRYATPVEPEVELELRDFRSRFDLAEYLMSRFNAAEFKPNVMDKKLWAWLAYLYFERICLKARDGRWDIGARQRWIPESSDWRRYYRHLIAGPWSIFRTHEPNPERALAVLCQHPGRPGDVVEQLASRQEIITSPALMQLATSLFVEGGKIRRGAGGKGAGSARRFASVVDQFDLTWNFEVIGFERVRALMPAEFKAS